MGHVFLEREGKEQEGCWKPAGALKSFAWMGAVSITSAFMLLPKQVVRINVLSTEWKVCLSQRRHVTD